jgi:peptidoglycan/LPS O-acetylase OafA/YrhL
MPESLLAQPLSPSRPSSAKAPRLPAFYRPELDALRFFAFLSVYVSHSLPREASAYIRFHLPVSVALIMSAFANACASGVQLFFLLSAFLITSLLLREEKLGEIHLKSFYVRRILRKSITYATKEADCGLSLFWRRGSSLEA